MSSGTWIEGNAVHIDDVHTWPSVIPVRDFADVHKRANEAPEGMAKYGIRWFDRDALNGAADLLAAREQCTYGDQWTRCDQYTPQDLTQPRPRCDAHKLEN